MADFQRTYNFLINAKNGASKTLSQVEASLKKTGDATAAINSKFNALIGLGLVNNFKDLTKEVINVNDDLNDFADRTGVSVTELSKLKEIAVLGAVDLDTLAKSVFKLGIEADKSPAKFEAMGIHLKDANGQSKDGITLFEDLAEKIANTADASEQQNIAFQALGKAGYTMLPVLKLGKQGMQDFKAEVKALGAEVSDAQAALAGKFNDNLQRVGIAAKGAANVLADKLLPNFNYAIEIFLEFQKAAIATSDGLKSADNSANSFANSGSWDVLLGVLATVGDTIVYVVDRADLAFNYINKLITKNQNLNKSFDALITFDSEKAKRLRAEVEKENEEAERDVQDVLTRINTRVKFTDQVVNARIKANEKLRKDEEKAAEEFKKKEAERLKPDASRMQRIFATSTEEGLKWDGVVSKRQEQMMAEIYKDIEGHQKKVITASANTMKSLQEVSDTAIKKHEDSLSRQKQVAEEFDALQKRLTAATPTTALKNSLGKIDRNAAADKALKEREDAKKQALDDANLQKEIDAQQAKLEAAKAAIEAENTARARSDADDAKRSLDNLQRKQKEIQTAREAAKEAADDYKARNIEEDSYIVKLQKKAAVFNEIQLIQKQIAQNADAGVTNELELERLREVGKVLQENKDAATNLFSEFDISNYARQLKDLANQATKADTETLKAQADAALKNQIATLKELTDKLTKLPIALDNEDLLKMRDSVIKSILEATNKTEYTVQVRANVLMPKGVDATYDSNNVVPDTKIIKRATGGFVYGPGTGTSDSILARLSNGEYVMTAAGMQQPGMHGLMEFVRSGGQLRDYLNRYTPAFANGGPVNVNRTTNNNVNHTFTLVSENGKVLADSSDIVSRDNKSRMMRSY